MMNKKTITVVLLTALIVLMVAPRLRTIPGVNRIPTI